MGIQALPNPTVRAIGASQVLNDPAAVIKELVDNALDARATSIAIEVSSNTLDSLQVRDNGHGIPPEDRQLVARPHCTSKIGSEDDLKDIGGSSLGFRGEALASAAEMSGSLTISTRLEGEQVATGLKISQNGEVEGHERASLPVGTTVKLCDFLKAHPVRKQVALKNADNCLKKMKQTLQAYAFTRPHVRLSLRVLKAKNDKGNWTYAPKAGGNAEDAAFKIVGAGCASQCAWSVIEDEGFTLQAFLPRVDAGASKISNLGSFLSVDARPVSSARGTPKQIVKIFREALKQSNADFGSIKDPFIFLQIKCPSASYDANVEPAKDDVLFESPASVVKAARTLFDAAYPAKVSEPSMSGNIDQGTEKISSPSVLPQEADDYLKSLEVPRGGSSSLSESAEFQSILLSNSNSDSSVQSLEDEGSPNLRRSFRPNMYGCDEEDLELLDARPPTGRTEADFEELRQARKDVNVSNPWVMARLNATQCQPEPVSASQHSLTADNYQRKPDQASSQRHDRPSIDLDQPMLPTPRPSSPSPPAEVFHPSSYVPDMRLARDGRMIGSQSLPAPTLLYERSESEQPQDQHLRQPPTYDYTMSSQTAGSLAGTPLNAIPDAGAMRRRSPQKRPQQTHINRPFVSPMHDQLRGEKVWFDHLEENEARPRPAKRSRFQPRGQNGLVTQGELGDLVEDPRPLTPPRQNRDMRDFVTSVDLTGDDSIASMIETRNYARQKRTRSVGEATHWPDENDQNAPPVDRGLSGRGFMPASELAAMESRLDLFKADKDQPAKRRMTSEARALRQLSTNSIAPLVLDDEDFEPDQRRTKSSRRRTTEGSTKKTRRMKSAKLPLERIPAGQTTIHMLFNAVTTSNEISRMAGNIDEEKSLPGWNEHPTDRQPTFDVIGEAELQEMTARLRELLVNRVSNGDMVQDLQPLVENAFATRQSLQMDVELVEDV